MSRTIFKDKIKIGDRFVNLTTLSYDDIKSKWHCKCDCGETTYVSSSSLAKGIQKSCSCGLSQLSLKNGDRFGHLMVIKWDKKRKKWHCKCDCGNDAYASTQALRTTQKGCGCQQKGPKIEIRLPNNEALKNALYLHCKKSAEKRKKQFLLSKEIFYKLVQDNCYYCGNEPKSTAKYFNYYDNNFRYNGIDRIDSNKGYLPENVVACCKICNSAKSTLSVEDFRNWIKKVYDKQFCSR